MNQGGFESCTGCGVCLLSCPVWRQGRDPLMTICGRARALQGGASREELSASVFSCLLCGACLAVCPSRVDTVGLTLGLRSGMDHTAFSSRLRENSRKRSSHSAQVLIPGSELGQAADHLKKVLRCLGNVRLPLTHAEMLSDTLKNGTPVESVMIEEFADQLSGAGTVIVADGLLHRLVRATVPGVRVMGLGEALLGNPGIIGTLGPGDLYVIEPGCFHSDYRRLIGFYDGIRRDTGCEMNLDLQRSAVAVAGICGASGKRRMQFDPVAQARWILEGRKVTRIVVESIADIEPFRKATALTVLHLSELLPGS